MKEQTKGEVILLGAGPGDPELITLKGLRHLKQADVILYDALVNPILLNHNSNALKIAVGKRKGCAKKTQEEINQLIVHYALGNKTVVRLKGGDPLLFGRACEELQFATDFGIETTIIPGISSFVGIAAKHQIPLTKRAENESIWITTGYTKEGDISNDIPLAAQSSATIVVLMGIHFLEKIISIFKQHKPSNYPVAVIQNGTTLNERVMVSTLNEIVEEAKTYQITNPATLIFGSAIEDSITQYKNVVKKEICYT